MNRLPLAPLVCALALLACTDGIPLPDTAPPVPAADSTAPPPFDFERPSVVIELPGALREISGLTPLPGGLLGAVQDEDGLLYVLEPDSGRVVGLHRFAGGGDYEGVELLGDEVVVLRSDGDLYRFPLPAPLRGESRRDVSKIETALSSSCDAEGLAASGGQLLIACKEYAGKDLKHRRAMYRYDPEAAALAPTPALVLDLRGDPKLRAFKPSALAVHPDGRVFVLSSVMKAVWVLAPDGATLGRYALPARFLPQPEGLALLGDALYISSEGRPATLVRFLPPGSQ